jgi:hypothetical protein
MIWIVTVVFFLIAIVTAVIVLLRKSLGVPLFEVAIATNDGCAFAVSYQQRHAEMQAVEYVRMILYFAAKMLFIIGDRQQNEARRFIGCILLLGDSELSHETDVVAMCRIPIVVSESSAQQGCKVQATLSYQNIVRRSIWTTIPQSWFPNQFLYSWIAIVQTALPKLDEDLVDLLRASLNRMAAMYLDNNVDPSSITALANAPAQAFIDADMSMCSRRGRCLTTSPTQ